MVSIFSNGVEAVCSALIVKAGEILLVRSDTKWAGKWCLPGGHIEPGEKAIECIKREVLEETNLLVEPVSILQFGELINSSDFHRPAHFVYFDFLCDLAGGELKIDNNEISEASWFSPQNIPVQLGDSYKQLIDSYLEGSSIPISGSLYNSITSA